MGIIKVILGMFSMRLDCSLCNRFGIRYFEDIPDFDLKPSRYVGCVSCRRGAEIDLRPTHFYQIMYTDVSIWVYSYDNQYRLYKSVKIPII